MSTRCYRAIPPFFAFKVKTPIAEGMRIQYNFVKPHMALKGKTPAQKAGIVKITENGNKWRDLLEFAQIRRGKN